MNNEIAIENNKNHKAKYTELNGSIWLDYSISVWNISKTFQEIKLGHPAMFPVELPKRLIKIYTKKGDTILDPFMGSGSTLVASKELGREGIGFEINENFIKLAKQRLKQKNCRRRKTI